jgi:hypothetical protein
LTLRSSKAILLVNHRRELYLSGCGRYVEAEGVYEIIIADMGQLFRLNDSGTFNVMRSLAWAYQSGGRYVDAETLFKRVLESRKT